VNRSDLTPLSSNSEAHELNISTVGKSAHQNHNMSSQPPSSPKQADPPAPPSSNNTTTEEEPSKPSSTTTTSPPKPTNPRLTALEAKKATLEQTLSPAARHSNQTTLRSSTTHHELFRRSVDRRRALSISVEKLWRCDQRSHCAAAQVQRDQRHWARPDGFDC
jgi:hypothetical protein